MDNTNNKLSKFISFNCKSITRSIDCVRSLCQSVDIVALQETWLLPHDIPQLGTISQDFGFTGKSAVDTSSGGLRGRPYGGVAILWRKNVFTSVSVIQCDSDRLVAIKIVVSERTLLIFSVYMPTDSLENLTEFTQCLSEIYAIIENQVAESVFILGDFNAHPGVLFGTELQSFCSEQRWLCADIENLGINSNTYTYISDSHSNCRRWLDHCVVTEAAWQSVVDVEVLYDVYYSDHLPLLIVCDLNILRPKVALKDIARNKVIWGKRED